MLAVVGLLVVAAVVVLFLVLQGSPYRASAVFENASQLVKGDLVQVAGTQVGKIEDIRLTDDGRARVYFTIEESGYSPLRLGTRAVIRQVSLSGIANRYIDLQLGGARGKEIENGGQIPGQDTQSTIEIDQLFNLFDEDTRKGLQHTIRLFRDLTAGETDEANVALRYINPALSASARLFREINRDPADLERFITETSRLVTDLSVRDDELAGLVTNLATTMDAIASERDDLGRAIGEFPPFMRRANTTFVNLRATLDDLEPLIDDTRPVIRPLRRLLRELRPFARDARPTLRDLSRTVRAPGADNDLVELLRRQPQLEQIAIRPAQRNGAERPGAFPETRTALRGVTPQLGFLRPYSPELVGWFDDFSTSGAYDALGSFSRAGLQLNAFTFTPALEGLNALESLVAVPPALRDDLLAANLALGRDDRCPGAVERGASDGSNLWRPSPNFDCDPSQVPVGP